jgi:hypothetical protein
MKSSRFFSHGASAFLRKQATPLLFISGVFSACQKEINYECSVTNNTSYRIDKMEFSCAADNYTLSVEPNSSSPHFNLVYRRRAGRFFTEPLLCVTITGYSDSTAHYQNTYGQTFSIRELSKSTSSFHIKYEPNPLRSTDIFKVSKE